MMTVMKMKIVSLYNNNDVMMMMSVPLYNMMKGPLCVSSR